MGSCQCQLWQRGIGVRRDMAAASRELHKMAVSSSSGFAKWMLLTDVQTEQHGAVAAGPVW
jgi:hypothetical protein